MHSENPFIVLAILIAGALFSSANAQENQASLTQNFQTQHEMGHHFRIDPAICQHQRPGQSSQIGR